MHGLDRLRTEMLCPVGERMFSHRTLAEIDYLESVRAIPPERLEAWRVVTFVDPVGWVWNRAQLLIYFSFLRKNCPHWNVFCRNERRMMYKHNVLSCTNA